MTIGFKRDGVQVAEFDWDFAIDGGVAGAFNLQAKLRKAGVPIGALIKKVTAKVLTLCESAGAATLIWGNGDDADGYSGTTAVALGSLTAGAYFTGYENAGPAALLWDDTNDHPLYVPVLDADDGKLIATIGTADMTAGKVLFLVEFYYPGTEA